MITLDIQGVKQLEKDMGEKAYRLPELLATSVNETAKKVKVQVNKNIREHLAVKAKDIRPMLEPRKRANKNSISALIVIDKEKRLSLKRFGAKQTKQGVSYTLSKKAGKRYVPGGFMGPRPGVIAPRLNGHAFKRTGKGRTPIAKLHGASPWGAYVVNHLERITVVDGNKELTKQINRQLNRLYKQRKRNATRKGR